MKISKSLLRFAALTLSGLALTGCMNLRRVSDPTRFYVLSAVPTGTVALPDSRGELAVGLGRVDLPAYLLDRRIVVRKGPHEIDYCENHWWAERLDKGIQRALSANLSSLLSSDRVLLNTWRRGEVGAEVYVSVQRFDCDDQGQVILEARWRITSPGAEKIWRAGDSQLTRPGPALRTNPEGTVNELSHALADLSQQIATAAQSLSTNPGVSTLE